MKNPDKILNVWVGQPFRAWFCKQPCKHLLCKTGTGPGCFQPILLSKNNPCNHCLNISGNQNGRFFFSTRFLFTFYKLRRRQNLCISILRLGQSNSRKEWFFFTPNFTLQIFLHSRDLVMVSVWSVFIQLVDSAKWLFLRVGHKFFFGISQLPHSPACPL